MSRKPTTYQALLNSHLLTGRITRQEYINAINWEIVVQKGHLITRYRLVKLYPNRAAAIGEPRNG